MQQVKALNAISKVLKVMLKVEINNARVLTKRELPEYARGSRRLLSYSSRLHSSLSLSLLVSLESGLHKQK